MFWEGSIGPITNIFLYFKDYQASEIHASKGSTKKSLLVVFGLRTIILDPSSLYNSLFDQSIFFHQFISLCYCDLLFIIDLINFFNFSVNLIFKKNSPNCTLF